MKILYTLIVAGALLFAGCASVPNVEKPAQKVSSAAAPVTKKAPVKVEKTVFYPVKEISYYGDGSVAETTLYTYDDNGVKLLKKEVLDSDGVLEEMETYTYSGPVVTTIKRFDKNKKLQGYHVLSYNAEKECTVDALYNAKKELQSKSEYTWKGGKKVAWKVYDSSGALLSVAEYVYKNGLNVRINNVTPGGDLVDYFILDYNAAGLLVKNTHFSKMKKVLDARTFSYKNEFLVMVTVLRGNGSVKRKIAYSNDSHGNPIEITYMDAGNNVSERVVKEYKSRKEISDVTE